MDSAEVASSKPHAICIPFPIQSHIKAMQGLAKLLYLKGFHITFVNTEFNHSRLLKSGGPLDGLPGFRFEAIPDGLPPSDADATQDISSLCDAIDRGNFLAPLSNLLAKLNDTATSNVPPVSCIVSDGFMAFTTKIADELEIPIAMLLTISACAFMGFKHFGALRDKGLTPLIDESYLSNGYLDTVVDWIPGMKNIRLRDLPSYIRTRDPNDPMYDFCINSTDNVSKATAIVFHSFDALEHDVLDALSSRMFPNIYAIGPLTFLLNEIPENSPTRSIAYNLWKEDTECLLWLNSWPSNSVLYVNFGSVTVMTSHQLTEFGWGLANSKHPFLWIIRPGLVIGEETVLPQEFVAETKGRGMVTSWCPQEQVLNNQSIGGFLTHCGWNSRIESISAGVPMLCWPSFGDQQTNCRYICKEWEIGLEIDDDVKREEVEKVVREVMEGEKGKKMRSKAMEWKRKAEEATGMHGSSSSALNKLADQLLLYKKTHETDLIHK